ncbi:YcbK family protein [Pukyongiella litopenaei]|uniref:DUF882 domain-containing protein n=1 Tax=Pukyongiella litopenaei TaxID=2605946 RepID=A0A2S0MTC1_9RHOB|nr:D-Ala-D-Ala carboxypeptidase family metallohydrolase [Pukyongiella litopenaei]AVO39144.1 DUF882 domain-containing protein [Pukyongiella litopenaei]
MSDRDQHTDKQKRLANLQQHMARANHEEGIRTQYDRRIAHTQSQIGDLLRTSQERIDRLYNPSLGITREPRSHNRGGGITEPDTPDRRTSGMTPAATKAFSALESSYGPLSVTSAHRSPEHNRSVGGARNSQHLHGNAYDIDVSNLTRDERIKLIQAAREAGFKGVGVYDNSLHFDVGPPRAWGSDYTRNTVPDWARSYVR